MKAQQEQHEQNRGSGMVISNSREFDDSLMLKILQPKASDCEYRAYIASLYGLSNQIKERFPLLTLTLLPASEKVLAYIKGDLIPRKELQDYGKTAAINHGKTFPIFAKFYTPRRKFTAAIPDKTPIDSPSAKSKRIFHDQAKPPIPEKET